MVGKGQEALLCVEDVAQILNIAPQTVRIPDQTGH